MVVKQGVDEPLPENSSKDGGLGSSHVPISDLQGLARELLTFLCKSPNLLGGADIYNCDLKDPQSRAGMLTAVLIGIIDAEQRQVVRGFVIVVPSGLDVEACEVRAWGEVVATFRHLAGRDMKPSEQENLRARFRIIETRDRRSGSVLDVIKAQAEGTAIIVTDAAVYREDHIGSYSVPNAPVSVWPEDLWVPQLHALATAAVEIARELRVYVAIDANRLSPRRKELSELLCSINGCGVCGSSNDEDRESIIVSRVDQWNAWIGVGRVGRVLQDIDQLPDNLDRDKPYLRIQMLNKAGLFPQVLQAIREHLTPSRKLDPSARVKLARIAQNANASRLANEILASGIDELDNQEDLESALATTHDTGSMELEGRVAARLDAMFPGSPGLRKRRRRALLAARDYAGVAAMAAEESGQYATTGFYSTLGRYLSGTDVPDYYALIASSGGDIPLADAYRMACVSDALARNLVIHAFEFAQPIPETPDQAERGEQLLLYSLEAILLHVGKDGTLPVANERVQEAALSLIERLASNPNKQALRVGLARILQPSIAGTTGLALMAFLVFKLASRPVQLQKRHLPGRSDAAWLLEREHFLNAAFDWLKGEEPVVIGRSVLPGFLLTESADEVVSAIADYLNHAPLESDEDAATLHFWLALAASVTPHSSDADFDLRLMRVVAGKLASSGYAQLARDLAEQALQNSTATPRRRRLGWFVMADVYHRCHNNLEGLLAIACTLAADDAGDEEQLCQEINGIGRLLRDCGLHDQARAVVGTARRLFRRMGLSDGYSHRLETLELQIRHAGLLTSGASSAELEALLVDVVRNGVAVLEKRDTTEPAAVMLGQLLRQAEEAGVAFPPEAVGVFAKLCEHAKGSIASLVETMSLTTPSAEDLFSLLSTSSQARYSDDLGYDMHNLAIAARRALTSDTYIGDAVGTSFALEMLADWGVAVPGWDEAAEPPLAPKRVDEPAEIARSISREGISVVQAGFDASGRLVRVSAVEGRLEAPMREPDDVMLEERLRLWTTKFPKAYGTDETTANLFYTTTADLRLSSLPDGPVVVVADAALQPFPPNLFFIEEEFAGRTRPMAAAPSLSWLHTAQKERIGDGRLCAWISAAEGGNESPALPVIAWRLEPTFQQYGIVVDKGPTLPAAFAGASLAVIAAHGSIHPEGRYFQVVSDEGSLRVTAGDLANALRNVGVVILFVCNGGRADKHPGANTTLGLAKEILDRGCAAVIASPWPLYSLVPSHWLPEFLRNWFQGKSLIEANFEANQVVDRNFSQNPAQGLAMTIFGNPLLRRN